MSLQYIQENLNVPKLQHNSFGDFYYRSLEDILEALKPHLAKLKYTLVLHDEIVCIEGWHYVKANAILTDDKNKTVAENTAYARETETKKGMDAAQITGATSSYARKYALNGMFLCDDTKDADATNTHGKEPAKKIASKKTPAEPIDIQNLTADVAKAETEADLTALMKTYTDIIKASSNQEEAVGVFTARKKEIKKETEK